MKIMNNRQQTEIEVVFHRIEMIVDLNIRKYIHVHLGNNYLFIENIIMIGCLNKYLSEKVSKQERSSDRI